MATTAVDENFLRRIFAQVDKDRSGHIDSNELQSCLSNGTWEPFNIETVRLVMSLFDKAKRGQLNYEEFKQLWKYIDDWLRCFQSFDKDKSGFINKDELKQAITVFGQHLSDDQINALMIKHAKRGQVGKIFFDDFIQISVTLQMNRSGQGNTNNTSGTPTTTTNTPASTVPPVDENFLRTVFGRVDKDRSGYINAPELQSCLSNGTWEPFNFETINLMIGLFDKTQKGQVSYEEFKLLWKYVEDWRQCFMSFDKDKSGFINRDELKQALTAFGFQITDDLIDKLLRKYAKGGQVGRIYFDDFIQISVSLQSKGPTGLYNLL